MNENVKLHSITCQSAHGFSRVDVRFCAYLLKTGKN